MGENDENEVSASFTSFEVNTTYGGLVEGTRETASEHLIRELKKEYPADVTNNGYALVIPDGPCLPNWTCKAYLDSGYRFDEEDDGSKLLVCWFVEELKDSMQEMVDDLLKEIDWQERARRYDMCMF